MKRGISLVSLLTVLIFIASCSVRMLTAEPTFAEWHSVQENWSNETLNELNFRASETYREITGSRFSTEELMARNQFYWFFPDFQAAHAGQDLACNQGTSRTFSDRSPINSYYLPYGVDEFFVAMIFHENLHSDVPGWRDVSNMVRLAQPGLMVHGFETNLVALDEPLLNYFDEAFVDLLRAYIMREAGFADFDVYGSSYQPGVEVLKPVFEEMLANGITLRDLYILHTNSDLEGILRLIGETVAHHSEPQPDSMSDEEYLVALGFGIASQAHFVVLEEMRMQTEVYVSLATVEAPVTQQVAAPEVTIQPPTTLRATCGMELWFSPQQYQQTTSEFTFPPDVWRQNTWGNWVIEEENYYLVIDQE
jgi:hypothetical protein